MAKRDLPSASATEASKHVSVEAVRGLT
jgi:hypothetical protein